MPRHRAFKLKPKEIFKTAWYWDAEEYSKQALNDGHRDLSLYVSEWCKRVNKRDAVPIIIGWENGLKCMVEFVGSTWCPPVVIIDESVVNHAYEHAVGDDGCLPIKVFLEGIA